MSMTIKEKIHNLEWGSVDVRNLTAEEIEQIIDFCVPLAVMQLLCDEITRRREMRLEQNRKLDK